MSRKPRRYDTIYGVIPPPEVPVVDLLGKWPGIHPSAMLCIDMPKKTVVFLRFKSVFEWLGAIQTNGSLLKVTGLTSYWDDGTPLAMTDVQWSVVPSSSNGPLIEEE